MKRTLWWVVLVVLLGGSVAGFYYWLQRERQALQPPPPAETRPAPEARPEPQIRHPIPQAQPAQVALPPLDDSDRAVEGQLAGVLGKKSFEQFFHLKDIVRHVVVTIDNLPRKKTALRLMPVKPTEGRFVTTGDEEGGVISPDNYRRYTPAVRLAEAVDAGELVAVYIHFYPLFQQAYAELGYPSGYFNDRLVEVIDHLLATSDVQGPVKLVRPKVMYQFADPELEALSAGQKILVRMGSENAARIKAKLREVRQELTAQAPKQ